MDFFFRNVKFDRFIPSLYQNLRYKNKMCYFLVFSYKSKHLYIIKMDKSYYKLRSTEPYLLTDLHLNM